MELKILETFIVIFIAILMLFYYYQLYKTTKLSRLLLILEVGIRAMSFIVVLVNNGINSYEHLLHFVPIFLSITLYLSKDELAKFLFFLLICMITLLLINHLRAIYI